MTYDPRKAAQTIAYFALKNGGHALNVLMAVKLVYLADRESVRRSGFPIQDEDHYSLPQGPVNSSTYKHIRGEVRPEKASGWYEFLADRENHRVGLNGSLTVDDLDELSDADCAVLDFVWQQFGHMNHWDLVDWTHDSENVPEWEDPSGSSQIIPLARMMRALGLEEPESQSKEVKAQRGITSFMESL